MSDKKTELVFIRHGQGAHNLDVPDRLNIRHPNLTAKGRGQVSELRNQLNVRQSDIFIVSPTVRTIETALLLTERLAQPGLWVHPLAGPRMFPFDLKMPTSGCDIPLPLAELEKKYPNLMLLELGESDGLHWEHGINRIDQAAFRQTGQSLLDWIGKQDKDRAFIISHDGTITCYRELLGQQGLTRADFPGEAGFYKMEIP